MHGSIIRKLCSHCSVVDMCTIDSRFFTEKLKCFDFTFTCNYVLCLKQTHIRGNVMVTLLSEIFLSGYTP